jgi:hypothetical protein
VSSFWGKDVPNASHQFDRRVTRRYELSVPVTVWLTALDSVSIHVGRTRGISTSGMYFILACALHPGTALKFALTLPAELTGGTDLSIRGFGRVSRVDDRREKDFGIAVVVQRWISYDKHARSRTSLWTPKPAS